ncbi:MAG: beta-1-3, beta-1-6-glucan biosynthesis protein [Proteobacteria bacterium]|nr:MAG: beta-1-3, beta-1-6-glucan biosynthesis protein [Pseudomonadota bacterium]
MPLFSMRPSLAGSPAPRVATTFAPSARFFGRFLGAALALAVMVPLATGPGFAQSPDPKAEKAPAAGDAKDVPKKPDEFAEAERLLGGPAGSPECLWLGRRVVRLLARDDLDTAFRHLDLYDRFGCPAGHLQTAFRCVIRQGEIDQKAVEKIDNRVYACWINPNGEVQGTAAASSTSTNR